MGILSSLKDGPVEEITRPWKILDAMADEGVPAVEVVVAYCDPDKLQAISEELRGKVKDITTDPDYRVRFFTATFRSVRELKKTGLTNVEVPGISKQNLRRLCPDFLRKPSLYQQLPDRVTLDDQADVDWFAQHLAANHFQDMIGECLALDTWARQRIEQEKKDSSSSSASAAAGSRLSDASSTASTPS